ncbi:class IV adenylate cyclase [Aliiroseovarius sp. F47248L]|uniref:class IV adenylate cyclase n=1 Tax=Aliiroseovarius sp. F47248L TaxID=2926420 RepID=UPI001FF5E139|nr:class IV adenylate cyclase [Aliiroseovarius sp. F47248L]MCK0138918.1 class IV adenylate cyclase [Aliiroseovarius sp. F47248L]
MQEIFEIELRYRLGSEVLAVEFGKNVLNQGFKVEASLSQEDIYYSSKHKDFIESEECLRIRTVDGRSEITWKPPSTADMKVADEFWKEEVDLQIGSQHDIAKKMLNALDFFEVATVEKQRQSFVGPEGVEVSIDVVKGVGAFVELEVKHHDPDHGKRVIRRTAEGLGLAASEICRTPYRDLVREANDAA